MGVFSESSNWQLGPGTARACRRCPERRRPPNAPESRPRVLGSGTCGLPKSGLSWGATGSPARCSCSHFNAFQPVCRPSSLGLKTCRTCGKVRTFGVKKVPPPWARLFTTVPCRALIRYARPLHGRERCGFNEPHRPFYRPLGFCRLRTSCTSNPERISPPSVLVVSCRSRSARSWPALKLGAGFLALHESTRRRGARREHGRRERRWAQRRRDAPAGGTARRRRGGGRVGALADH
jgi:hypothetical protein